MRQYISKQLLNLSTFSHIQSRYMLSRYRPISVRYALSINLMSWTDSSQSILLHVLSSEGSLECFGLEAKLHSVVFQCDLNHNLPSKSPWYILQTILTATLTIGLGLCNRKLITANLNIARDTLHHSCKSSVRIGLRIVYYGTHTASIPRKNTALIKWLSRRLETHTHILLAEYIHQRLYDKQSDKTSCLLEAVTANKPDMSHIISVTDCTSLDLVTITTHVQPKFSQESNIAHTSPTSRSYLTNLSRKFVNNIDLKLRVKHHGPGYKISFPIALTIPLLDT